MSDVVYTKIYTDHNGKYYVGIKPYRSSRMVNDDRRFDTFEEAKKRAKWLYYNWSDK